MNTVLQNDTKIKSDTVDLQTVQLALLDAIEYAEERGDLNLAVIYAKLLRTKVDPALKRGYGV